MPPLKSFPELQLPRLSPKSAEDCCSNLRRFQPALAMSHSPATTPAEVRHQSTPRCNTGKRHFASATDDQIVRCYRLRSRRRDRHPHGLPSCRSFPDPTQSPTGERSSCWDCSRGSHIRETHNSARGWLPGRCRCGRYREPTASRARLSGWDESSRSRRYTVPCGCPGPIRLLENPAREFRSSSLGRCQ